MKIKITFSELNSVQAGDLVQFARDSCGGLPADEFEPKPEKPKRTRRTKVQIEADRAAAIAGAGSGETDPRSEAHAEGSESDADAPAPRRRRRRESETDTGPATAEANLGRGRRRREGAADPTKETSSTSQTSTTSSPSDDAISDTDVAKAASEGAQELTPKVVTAILDEFGVAFVNDLTQEQRREFIARITDDIENGAAPTPEDEAPKPKRQRRKK